MSSLADKTCVPCKGGVPPIKGAELRMLIQHVPQWKAVEEHHVTRAYTFPDFKKALDFVNRVGDVAEEQGPSSRHPSGLGQSRSHALDPQN